MGSQRGGDGRSFECCRARGVVDPVESSGIMYRIEEELRLARAQILYILFYACVLVFGAMHAYRNFAFYRYPDHVDKSERLRDLGFELIPRIAEDKKELFLHFSNLVQTGSIALVCIASLFGNKPGSSKPHILNMFRRCFEL